MQPIVGRERIPSATDATAASRCLSDATSAVPALRRCERLSDTLDVVPHVGQAHRGQRNDLWPARDQIANRLFDVLQADRAHLTLRPA